ncbi:MAG: fumarylacetoacetase [Crocinitomicaceae bacterium]|jgi:fumarylacetoacetase|nr:fumarylacetoacetase [Crocinitomicaceae bacterium]MBT6029083.1 fumarylacetoacetase [Crocinitomicaceae bacterium]
MNRANDPSRKSWVFVPNNSDFSIQNLPFGIFSEGLGGKRVGVAIGNQILDLSAVEKLGLLKNSGFHQSDFAAATLNQMMGKGKSLLCELRNKISDLLLEGSDIENKADIILIDQRNASMHLPIKIGDYTDFYSSEQHAYNVGCMFRDPNNALLPNWKHIPVGYHGRASSVINSGTPVHRPKGQQKPTDNDPPVFGPCKLLDFELEMGFITLEGKPLGDSISTAEANEYIFGMCLFNDWSARDIQKWEYIPLGPFLAKNFASSMSPWIVTLDALEPFRVPGPVQDPKVLPYLDYDGDHHIDINLQVAIQPEGSTESIVCNSNYKHMYWNMQQQLAHHTVNGCDIHAGDLLASGTISGPEEGQFGSMLEISWKGTKPFAMQDGSERKFIQDLDTVIMRGHAEKDGIRVGFGEVSTKILPTK